MAGLCHPMVTSLMHVANASLRLEGILGHVAERTSLTIRPQQLYNVTSLITEDCSLRGRQEGAVKVANIPLGGTLHTTDDDHADLEVNGFSRRPTLQNLGSRLKFKRLVTLLQGTIAMYVSTFPVFASHPKYQTSLTAFPNIDVYFGIVH